MLARNALKLVPKHRSIHLAVTCRDFPNSIQKRLKVRESHILKAAEHKKTGKIKLGGAIIENEKMVGSFFLFDVETKEEAVDILEKDPYTSGGVWKSWEINEVRLVSI